LPDNSNSAFIHTLLRVAVKSDANRSTSGHWHHPIAHKAESGFEVAGLFFRKRMTDPASHTRRRGSDQHTPQLWSQQHMSEIF